MEKRGLMNRDISFFLFAWRQMNEKRSVVDWKNIQPVTADQVFRLPKETSNRYNELYELGVQEMSKCAIIKLNGGRATTMGGTMPKCMIPINKGKNYLDIVMGQIMASNDRYGIEMPLILMASS